MSDIYSFTIDADGLVTEVYEVLEDGTKILEEIDEGETFEFIDGFVVEIESGEKQEWEVYAQDGDTGLWYEIADGDGVFDASILDTLTDVVVPPVDDDDDEKDDDKDDDDGDDDLHEVDAYVFEFDEEGVVTAVYEVEEDGTLDPEEIDENESYELIDGFVVEREGGDDPEWEVYAEDSETGYWYEVADGEGVFDPAILAELGDIELPPLKVKDEDDDGEGGKSPEKDKGGEELDAFVFEFDENGDVSAWFEVEEDGSLEEEDLEETEFSVINGLIVDIASDGPMPQWRVYVPNDEGTAWYKVAEGYGKFKPLHLEDLPANVQDHAIQNYLGAKGITYHWGDEGDDSLEGSAGDDHMGAGAGNDSASGGDGNDLMGGGAGDDSMSGDAGDDVIGAGQGNDVADGGEGADIVNGGAGDDTLSGAQGDDTIGASVGSDSVEGGDGHDNMGGGAGADAIGGGAGNDKAGGGEGNDTVSGGEGDDFLAGGGRDDLLDGGAGQDTLNGGIGDDTLTGGEGDDTFVFKVLKDGETDVITDFEDGDVMRLRGVDGDGAQGRFDALDITDTADGAEVSYDGHTIVVEGVSAADLGLEDFLFV